MSVRLLIATVALMFSTTALNAQTTDTGWIDILEIKSWSEKLEIMTSKPHSCPELKTHYVLTIDSGNYDVSASLLLTAFAGSKQVNINYACRGVARILGIRVKP